MTTRVSTVDETMPPISVLMAGRYGEGQRKKTYFTRAANTRTMRIRRISPPVPMPHIPPSIMFCIIASISMRASQPPLPQWRSPARKNSSLEQPHESCDDREEEEHEHENEFHHAHDLRFIIHPISHRSPHFGTSLSLRPIEITKGCQPASPSQEGRLTRPLRLTAHEAGVPVPMGRRGLRNKDFRFEA